MTDGQERLTNGWTDRRDRLLDSYRRDRPLGGQIRLDKRDRQMHGHIEKTDRS